MTLTDGKITLSPFQNADFEFFRKIITCPKMMEKVYEPLTNDEAKLAFQDRLPPWKFQSDTWRSFCITNTVNGQKLGYISLRIIDHQAHIAEVGYMIHASAQGKGVGSGALELIKHYAFSTLMLSKLVAFCSVDNTGSFKLLEKSGFSREYVLEKNTLRDNQYTDDFAYGLCNPAV